MSSFDFRGAHVTLAATGLAILCTVVNDTFGLSNAAAATVASTAASLSSRSGSGGGGLMRLLNNFFSASNGGLFIASAARFLSLPLAWPSLFSLMWLVMHGRQLERRFGSSRFAAILLFTGGTAAVLHRAFISTAAAAVATAASPSGVFSAINSSVWHAVIISLATLVSLRIPASRSPAVGGGGSRYPFVPVVLATATAGLGSYASANLIFGHGGRQHVQLAGGNHASALRVGAAALCALCAGALPAAVVHFYRPLMTMLHSVGDAAPVRSAVNRLLYGDASGAVYVRQHGAERQAVQRARAAQGAADDDEALRQAIAASLQGAGGAAAGAGGGGDEVRVLAGHDAGAGGVRRRGVNPNNMLFAGQQPQRNPNIATPAGSARPSAAPVRDQGPPTPAEQQSLAFLREILPGASDEQMLAVLRTCRGDPNAAAGLLLEGANR